MATEAQLELQVAGLALKAAPEPEKESVRGQSHFT